MTPWYFWVLAPVMVVTAIGLPLITGAPTWQGQLMLWTFSATLLLATIGLAVRHRASWALRGAGAAVFLAYLAYAAAETFAWWNGQSVGLDAGRGRASLSNALAGLFAIGLPALLMMLRGRSGTSVDVLVGRDSESVAESVAEPIGRPIGRSVDVEHAARLDALSRMSYADLAGLPHERSESAVVAGQDVIFETYRHTEIGGDVLVLVRHTGPPAGSGGRAPTSGFWMQPDGQVRAADEDEIADFFG